MTLDRQTRARQRWFRLGRFCCYTGYDPFTLVFVGHARPATCSHPSRDRDSNADPGAELHRTEDERPPEPAPTANWLTRSMADPDA